MVLEGKRVHHWIVLTAIALMVLTIAGAVPGSVVAQAEATPTAQTSAVPQFGLYPVGNYPHGYFEVRLKPGETEKFTAGLANSGQVAISLRVFAANATNPTNGGFAAGEEGDKAVPPTTWLAFSPVSLDLAPGAKQKIPFAITLPAGTAPGQYVTSLVASTTEAQPIPGTTALKQIIRSAVPILITVPGPVRADFHLGAPSFDATHQVRTLNVPITNTGNVLLGLAGELTAKTLDGKPMMTVPIALGKIFTGSSTRIQISLPPQFPAGEYLISLTLKDPATGATASIMNVKATLAPPPQATPAPTFTVNPVSVKPQGSPVQYADVSATIDNANQGIPTAKVTLRVERNGQHVEDYALAQSVALPTGETTVNQRYIPAGGWQPGTYTFQLIVAAVSNGAETILATVNVPGEIVVS